MGSKISIGRIIVGVILIILAMYDGFYTFESAETAGYNAWGFALIIIGVYLLYRGFRPKQKGIMPKD